MSKPNILGSLIRETLTHLNSMVQGKYIITVHRFLLIKSKLRKFKKFIKNKIFFIKFITKSYIYNKLSKKKIKTEIFIKKVKKKEKSEKS